MFYLFVWILYVLCGTRYCFSHLYFSSVKKMGLLWYLKQTLFNYFALSCPEIGSTDLKKGRMLLFKKALLSLKSVQRLTFINVYT